MLRTLPQTNPTNLLDFLVPTLLSRTRSFSTSVPPITKITSGARKRPNAISHSILRDQIIGQVHRRAIPESSKRKHNDLLTEVKRSLEKNNFERALAHWKLLQQEREAHPDVSLYQLPEKTERQMATLLQSTLTPDLLNKTRDDAYLFALQAATRDIVEALHAIMVFHLDRKEPQTVIELYHKYLHQTYTQSVEKRKKHASETGDDPSLLEDEEVSSNLHPGRSMLLLVVVVAHAMHGTFADALQTYQIANIMPLPYRREKLLKSLDADHVLQGKVQDYLHRLSIASSVSRPISLTKHIMNLAHPKSTRVLVQLYDDILDGITRPDPYLSLSHTVSSPTSLIPITEPVWTAFQTAFIRCERPDLAEKIWADLKKCGYTPGTTMWTALIDTFAALRDSTQAMKTWNDMLENGVVPDTLSYRAIISALFDDNKPGDAIQRFREYHGIAQESNDLALSVYNTVLRGLLRINRISDANALLGVMCKKGPKPDIISFNTFLGYYGRQKDFKSLSAIVAQMAEANIPGDVVTFSTILTALLSVGRKDATVTILNLMRKQGIQPNVATYSAIIDHQMREDTAENVTAALSVLDKMEQDDGAKPNEVTYTSILSGLYRNQNISRQRAEAIKLDILDRMKRARITFRLPTYHILIRAAMNSEDPNGYVDALALMEEMRNQGLPVTTTAWYIVLAGLMHRGLWDVANETVEKFISSNHEATPRLQKLIVEIQKH